MRFNKYPLLLGLLILMAACKPGKKLTETSQSDADLAMNSQVEKTSTNVSNEVEKEIEVKSELGQAQEEKPASTPEDKAAASAEFEDLEHALLWEISGKNLKEKSYLYGTIHLIEEDKFFWPDYTLESLDQSNQIAFEIDLDDMFNFGAIMGMMTKIMMKDGKTLKDLLDDEEYALVTNHFKDMGLPMFMLEKMKPMFLTVFAEGGMEPGGMEESGMTSYEMVLYEKAQNKEIEVLGLETMDDQISIFDSIPYESQAEMLVDAIKSSNDGSQQMEELVNMYLSQNINEMVQTVTEEDSEYKDFEDLILNNRNHNWIPHIENMMNEMPTFFAVGAGHLGGPEGVIHLLRLEGYTLTPLSEAEE